MTDTVLVQLIVTTGGVITSAITIAAGLIIRSNNQTTEKVKDHVDVAVDKGVEKVKQEMRVSRATRAVRDSVIGIPVVIADRAEVRP